MKPYSEACEENKAPILEVLRDVFAGVRSVLEIGSGTGQHAVYFAQNLPGLVWQSSDLIVNLSGIQAWQGEAELPNLPPPIVLDVNRADWPVADVDAVFSANTAHIMSWSAVQQMFAGVGRVLGTRGIFALYGPFSYGGCHVSVSNARFDAWLRERDPASGVRDFDALNTLAEAADLRLMRDFEMPVNNRTLVWRRREAGG